MISEETNVICISERRNDNRKPAKNIERECWGKTRRSSWIFTIQKAICAPRPARFVDRPRIPDIVCKTRKRWARFRCLPRLKSSTCRWQSSFTDSAPSSSGKQPPLFFLGRSAVEDSSLDFSDLALEIRVWTHKLDKYHGHSSLFRPVVLIRVYVDDGSVKEVHWGRTWYPSLNPRRERFICQTPVQVDNTGKYGDEVVRNVS